MFTVAICSWKVTTCLPPAPLKLGHYGAIRICILLLFLAHQEACRCEKIKERNACSGCLFSGSERAEEGDRISPLWEQWTGAETRMLSPWCPQWPLWSDCQFPEPAQQPSGFVSQLFHWRLRRNGDCRQDHSTLRSCSQPPCLLRLQLSVLFFFYLKKIYPR